MKKIIITLIALTVAVLSASAQKATTKTAAAPQTTSAALSTQDLNYVNLLNKQNKLLNQRQTALIIGLSGSAFASACYTTLYLIDSKALQEVFGIGLYVGAATALAGGVWGIVNEFQLINNKRKINDNLILKVNPNGIALQF